MTFDRAGVVDEVETTELQELIETLQELTARLAVIASWAASGATGLRVVGVSMPSTAVTGPATSAQVVAALLTQTTSFQRELFNILPTLANVNNCTGA